MSTAIEGPPCPNCGTRLAAMKPAGMSLRCPTCGYRLRERSGDQWDHRMYIWRCSCGLNEIAATVNGCYRLSGALVGHVPFYCPECDAMWAGKLVGPADVEYGAPFERYF